MTKKAIPSSFRDPSGFLFMENGTLYRQVNQTYKENYDQFINSGLYDNLVQSELLIPHDEVVLEDQDAENVYKILKPQIVPFISYPYEWCFSQLKDAALTNLEIQKKALSYGMTLKDSSGFNIQFKNGRPILIDTLSFEIYLAGQPWVAYRQFCQHFLALLALMSYSDIRLNQLFRVYIDGVPLDLASFLLPSRTWFKLSLLSHIHFHAKSQKYFGGKKINQREPKMTLRGLLGLIDNLESTIQKLKCKMVDTEWANYYEDIHYSQDALEHKKRLVSDFLDQLKPKVVWDLGANDGLFSRISSEKGIQTISFDKDPIAVEKNYQECVAKGETRLLPLLLDLTNPSPNIGWENNERLSFLERGSSDTALALALIHHLAISNNVPLIRIAEFFNKICRSLIIEFVPKQDSQVQRLLFSRKDIFEDYTQQSFEREFSRYFTIRTSVKIRNSERTLYLMEKGTSR